MSLRIIFAGTPDFAVPSLEALVEAGHALMAVYTQPDRPAGRGQKIQASPVKQYARQHGLPVFQPHTLKNLLEVDRLQALEADLMVVVAYGLILPQSILKIPRLGCLNVHGSLLPRWRGAAPIQRAILAGDTETGVTIMQMDKGLDTGAILMKAACSLTPADTTASLLPQLAKLGAETLVRTLNTLSTLKPEPQNNQNATYAPKISKKEALIDWQQSADFISKQIRAFNPWPVAFTGSEKTPIRIWQACPLFDLSIQGFNPGQLIKASAEGLDVATGEGVLRIEKLQKAGGRILTAADIPQAEQIALASSFF